MGSSRYPIPKFGSIRTLVPPGLNSSNIEGPKTPSPPPPSDPSGGGGVGSGEPNVGKVGGPDSPPSSPQPAASRDTMARTSARATKIRTRVTAPPQSSL